MRALKVLVIIMGVLIVAGVAVIGATIAGRLAKSRGEATSAASFTAPAIDLPAGAHIETMAAGSGRVILALVLTDGSRELVVIDLATGKKLGTVPLRAP